VNWHSFSEGAAKVLYQRFGVVDGFFVFGGMVSETLKLTNKSNSCMIDVEIMRSSGRKFDQKRNCMQKVLPVFSYCSNNKVTIFHKYHDPAEISFEQSNIYPCKETGLHGYGYIDSRGLEVKRFDSQQYFFMNCARREVVNKKLDFIFGAIIVTHTRKWLSDYYEKLQEEISTAGFSSRFYLTDKFIK
jgi:hypothetical protein